MPKIRRPTQAGAFYEGDAESLKRQIEECFLHKLGPGRVPKIINEALKHVVGLVCPHAGYMYSGHVAAHAYYRLAIDGKPDVAVIFGPNHTGYGSALAVMTEGSWQTPLGNVDVDKETAKEIAAQSKIIDIDDSAHRFEHSIEVQLPFLQYLYGSTFQIVPICFLMQDLTSAKEVGLAVAKALEAKNAVVIASSDMSHYVPHDKATKNDRHALEAAEKMDETRFYSIIESQRVSACGIGPIAALIVAAKSLGAKEAKLLNYKTSGDVIGDYSSVVGYAAVCFTK